MSYKTEFQSNNTDLQTILAMVNSLPDASESGFNFSHVGLSHDSISPRSYVYTSVPVTSYYGFLCLNIDDEYCMVKVENDVITKVIKEASTFHIESEEGFVNFHNTSNYVQYFIFGYFY